MKRPITNSMTVTFPVLRCMLCTLPLRVEALDEVLRRALGRLGPFGALHGDNRRDRLLFDSSTLLQRRVKGLHGT
jgi:hypothetical protein